MSEGCIGEQNNRIGKWKIENGKWYEASSEQIGVNRKPAALRVESKRARRMG
jgi:hypothetical protein